MEEKAKVSPEILQTVYLDEIASRLADITALLESHDQRLVNIYDWLESTVTKGELASISVNLSTSKGAIPVKHDNPWFECTIFNDGPDAIKISHDEAGLKTSIDYNKGDQIDIVMKKSAIKPVWLKCDSGSAVVRMVFKR